MSNANAGGPPEQVIALESAFRSVPGISEASVEKHYYSKEDLIKLEELNFGGKYADLPIAMLKRSEGNPQNEVLIVVEFRIEMKEQGLKALEFLSWWVRDQSRSGENLQIRTIGLPPMAGDKIQLGNTLRFWFEAYIVTESEDIKLVLAEMGKLANSINENLKFYEKAFTK